MRKVLATIRHGLSTRRHPAWVFVLDGLAAMLVSYLLLLAARAVNGGFTFTPYNQETMTVAIVMAVVAGAIGANGARRMRKGDFERRSAPYTALTVIALPATVLAVLALSLDVDFGWYDALLLMSLFGPALANVGLRNAGFVERKTRAAAPTTP